MADDPTKELPQSISEKILARLDSIDSRLDSVDARLITLENTVDKRLRETTPLWEVVNLRLTKIEEKFDLVLSDFFDLRAEQRGLRNRVIDLESKASD